MLFRRTYEAQAYRAWQCILSNVLLAWGGVNMLTGMALLFVRNAVLRHIGVQSIVWGAIDAAIALLGRRNADRQRGNVTKHARSFQRLVAVNAGLDVLYMLGGRALITGAQGRPERTGAGIGIVVQGTFLFLFDGLLTFAVRRWAGR